MARIFMAMNGKRINTLDDLRSNFNGKQMLGFFRAGRLQKWLEELGENDLRETLLDFQNENYDDETLLSMLMAAFELDGESAAAQFAALEEKNISAPGKPGNAPAPEETGDETAAGDDDGTVEQCWYCDGIGAVNDGTEICPYCQGKEESVPPQWLRTIKKNDVSTDEKLLCLARELMAAVQNAVSNCDDLTASQRKVEISLFEDLWKKLPKDNRILLDDLGNAVRLGFGINYAFDWCTSPEDALKKIAEKYLPMTCVENENRFKVRYQEVLKENFEVNSLNDVTEA